MKTRRWNRRNPSTRAAASIEAVVALPVFAILFVGIFFLRDLTGARLRADQEARRCSWEYALKNNCGAKPAGCDGVVGKPHYGSLEPDVNQLVENLKSGAFSLDAKCEAQSGCSVTSSAFAKIGQVLQNFVLGYVSQAASLRFDASKGIEVERPGLFGGGTGVVNGKYGMACNIAAQEQTNAIDLVWDEFVK